jgi:predicted N-acyltransferase
MARGFLPTTVQSAHWLADERFLSAVDRFLEREREGIAEYIDELQEHSPLRQNRNVNIG